MFALLKDIFSSDITYIQSLYHKSNYFFQKQKYFCWNFLTDQEHLILLRAACTVL